MSIYDKASLVLIPSGTKTSKVYSQKPVSGDGDFTFSRPTAATRVNASGNIEKETQNLLLQSNSFNTTWTSANVVATSGQAGYDGTNDAWKLEKFAGLGNLRQTISSNGISTLSFYVKAGNLNWTRIIATGGSSTPSTWFDLQNGVVGSADFFTIDANIESVGSDWYRCSITFEVGSFTGVRIYPADGNNDVSGTSGYIYIQSAQLEQSLVARTYIETTTTAVEGGITDNVPRLDYTDSSCPALLLEPQRTNTFLTSEWFGIWDLNAGTTLTYNYAISPEGVQNATRYVGTGASGFGDKFTLTNGTQYTISAYVKSNTGATQFCRLIGDSSNISSDLEVTTEWARIDYTWTSGGLASKTNGIFRDSSNNDIDILVYGLQLEAGSYATSYIPTYGSAVTRNVETCSKTSATSLIGQTEGTLFAEFDGYENTGSEGNRIIAIGDGTSSKRIMILDSNTNIRFLISNSGTQTDYNSSISAEGNHKVAIAYANNDVSMYIDGVQVSTDSSASIPTCPNIYIGTREDGNVTALAGGVKKALVFKTRLTNAELAALTTI